jgi:NAD(P)-dependent dehydrogenase (short-subunit alcohol dehydrogenase family)
MPRRLDLSGKTVLITGGARGIGLETGEAAARRGATVALLDLDGEAAAARATALGGGSIGLRADVTDLEELDAAVAEVVARLGGIDVLVANAGVGPRTCTVDAGDRAHQRHILDVNLHGVWHTMWAAAPEVAARHGHVVVISSIAAYVLTPGFAAYSASKAAVEQLARCMRIELAPTGATVGVAHFGVIDTEMVRDFERDPITAQIEARAPAAVTNKVTAQSAAEALVRDIERRRPRTIHPARWRLPYALRGLTGPLSDALVVRDPRIKALMAHARARDLAEQAERAQGELAAPMGAAR